MLFHKLLLILTILLFAAISRAMVVIEEQAAGITLQCRNMKEWEKDGVNYAKLTDNGKVKITRLSDSDSGEYSCTDGDDRSSAFVFVKLCRNCVALDPSTIFGIVVGDLIATIFIAVAIYCVTTSNKDKGHRASDKQNLVPRDQNDVYQDLGKRRGSCEYSQLAPRLKL